jgi:hypothetical protein
MTGLGALYVRRKCQWLVGARRILICRATAIVVVAGCAAAPSSSFTWAFQGTG